VRWAVADWGKRVGRGTLLRNCNGSMTQGHEERDASILTPLGRDLMVTEARPGHGKNGPSWRAEGRVGEVVGVIVGEMAGRVR
jgi:hypothetical protein